MEEYYPGGSQSNVYDAEQIVNGGDGNPGACPPLTIRFRIYPVLDFSQEFSNPPPTVITG